MSLSPIGRAGAGVWWIAVGCGGSTEPGDPGGPGDPPTTVPVPIESCNGLDDDGDGAIDEELRHRYWADADGDGLGDPAVYRDACVPLVGYTDQPGDCDDTDPAWTGPIDEARVVDASVEAGLADLGPSWTGYNPCIHEALGGGLAAGDIDDDGDVDLFFPRMYTPSLLVRNDGTGRFTVDGAFPAIDGAWSGAQFVDVDGDRDLDLAVSPISADRIALYVNDGTGGFVEDGAARGFVPPSDGGCADQFGISAGDVDGDADLDLFVAGWQERLTLGERAPS
ncbi:MAG: VCBS repeat-containing protein, partial [Myxococcota bacterium]